MGTADNIYNLQDLQDLQDLQSGVECIFLFLMRYQDFFDPGIKLFCKIITKIISKLMCFAVISIPDT